MKPIPIPRVCNFTTPADRKPAEQTQKERIMNIAKTTLLASIVMTLAAPAFARGTEGHHVNQSNTDASYTASMNFVEDTGTFGTPDNASSKVEVGTTPDGRTVFGTTAESRDTTLRGPSR